jgi:hypothetical protein
MTPSRCRTSWTPSARRASQAFIGEPAVGILFAISATTFGAAKEVPLQVAQPFRKLRDLLMSENRTADNGGSSTGILTLRKVEGTSFPFAEHVTHIP